MPTNRYQQIRRRFIIAVATLLAVLIGMLAWESIYDYHRIVSEASSGRAEVEPLWLGTLLKHGSIAILLTVFIVTLSFFFLRQMRRLEMITRQLEEQQQELAVKAIMIDSALDAILLLDEKGRLLQFNNALCDLTGLSRRQLETMRIQDVMPPDKADKVEGRIQEILAAGHAVFESQYLHTSGAIVAIEGHARSIKIGQRLLVLSNVRDIGTQKEFEHTLKKASSEWRDTFDAVEDVIWLLDMDRRIVRANKATQTIFGKSPQQVLGLHCCQATYGAVKPREHCPFEQMLGTGKRASFQLFRERRWFEISVDPVLSADGLITNAVYIVKDITALKMAEMRERVRGEILERIAGNEPLPQLLMFIAVAIEKVSPDALCSIMLADEEGTRLLSAAAPSLPDFYSRAANRTRIAEGAGACGTAAFRRERVVVEDFLAHPFWKGFTPAQEAGLRSCWSEPIVSSSGQLLGTFAIYHRQPLVPGAEETRLIEQAATFAAIALERSRGETERAELELQLGQSQKMEAIGHLAGGVAHDFNNLLTPIIVYADLLKRALLKDEKQLPKIEGIIKASHKARDLTQQLLSFGRKQVMQMQVVDLNEVIASFYSIMRRTLRESIAIDLKLCSHDAIISADRSKLDQVILNLAVNAQDALAETGHITIETGQVMIDDEYARQHPGMKTGDYILLSFSDDGCGMCDATLRHIFEPFYTTKQVGHGTGLGLANVYGIVKQHNGYIAVTSKVGSGTTFKMYFPLVHEQPAGHNGPAAHPATDHAGSETILLVEDNEMVRVMTAELLEGFGYRVHIGVDPEQALELARHIPEKIELLITDVVMPGMNGLQLFERLKTERPDIEHVLYISGYTNNVIVSAGAPEEDIHFLSKPFTVDALLAKVRSLLGRTPE